MAFRSAGTPSSHATLNPAVTLNAPAGYQAGDFLLALLSIDVSSDCNSTMTFTGWTFITELNFGSDRQSVLAYWKAATGSDSFDVSNSASLLETAAVVLAFTGRDTSSTPSAVQTTGAAASATPITCTPSGVTAAAGDDVVCFSSIDQGGQTDEWTFSSSSGFTEALDYASANWSSICVQYQENVSAGATGSLSFTATRTVGVNNAGNGHIVLAIPAAGGGQAVRSDQQARLRRV